jgi:hypothetical protein
MVSLKKGFKNNIKNGLRNILKRNYKCVLIMNTFIKLNRSFDKIILIINGLLILKIEYSKY